MQFLCNLCNYVIYVKIKKRKEYFMKKSKTIYIVYDKRFNIAIAYYSIYDLALSHLHKIYNCDDYDILEVTL